MKCCLYIYRCGHNICIETLFELFTLVFILLCTLNWKHKPKHRECRQYIAKCVISSSSSIQCTKLLIYSAVLQKFNTIRWECAHNTVNRIKEKQIRENMHSLSDFFSCKIKKSIKECFGKISIRVRNDRKGSLACSRFSFKKT